MTNGILTMSQKEVKCLEIIQRAVSKELRQAEAAELLNITTRQVRNLKKRYLSGGAEGLISKQRGKPSNNRLDDQIKKQALKLLETQYADFGPTLASEKLLERNSLKLSKESV